MTIAEAPAALPILKAAQQAGIFAQNGLDVTLTPITNIALLIPAVTSGQYDFVESVQTLYLQALTNHLELSVTGGGSIDNTGPGDPNGSPVGLAMMVAKNGISTAQDFQGKTVGTAALAGNYSACFKYWLHTKGVDPSSVTLKVVPLADQGATLKANGISAALAPPPFSTTMAQSGYTNLGDPCTAVGGSDAAPNLSSMLVSKTSWATTHKPVIAAVQKSIDEANTWMHSHVTETHAIYVIVTGVSPAIEDTQPIATFVGHETSEDLTRWVTAMTTLGMLKAPVDTSNSIITP